MFNVAVIGIGGVGGYFGGKLCGLLKEPGRFRVTFVARGEHLRAIRDSGLRLSTESEGDVTCHPSEVTDDFRRLPILDLCLVCVKAYDLVGVLDALKPRIREHSVVLPLLNGVDIHARVRSSITEGVVLPACVYVGTHIEAPGKVRQRGGGGRILFGPDPDRPDFAPGEVQGVFEAAGIASLWTSDIQAEIWRKYLFICAYGLVSAAYSKTLGEILGDDRLKGEVLAVANEALTLAKRTGVMLPDDAAEAAMAKAKAFPPEARTSFQRDFDRMERPDERDLFVGTMVRMARESGTDVPRTRALAGILEARKPAFTPLASHPPGRSPDA